jgi:FecR-like protein
MRRSKQFAPVLLLLLVCPTLAWAQSGAEALRNVGVVTTLAGNATVARAALPEPRPLRFKDDVFLRDRISTAERSIVRVLLGGKALVTVRELSALTITENVGRSTIDLSSGKIAMGVLRQRMRPGEVIEIRTPNAIAAIRGTVLVVELIREPGGSTGAPRYTTKVSVLHGLVEVSDPKNPGAPPAQVGTLESWSRTGSDPSALVPMSPVAAEQMFAGLHSAPQIAEGPSEFIQSVTTREQAKAVAVAEFLAPDAAGAGAGGDSNAPAAPPSAGGATTPGIADAPVVPPVVSGPAAGGGSTLGPTGLAQVIYNGQTIATRGNFYSLSAGRRDDLTVPILEATDSSLSVGQSLMEVSGGATFSSTGAAPLLFLDPTKLSATSLLTLSGGGQVSLVGTLFQDQSGGIDLGSDLLHLSGGGTLVGTGASAIVDLVGSSASTASGLLSASGGAVLDLIKASAPLLSLTRSAALTTGTSLADISGGATVRLGQLASLTTSALTIQGHAVNLSGATLNVAGDLFRLERSTLTITGGALLNVSSGAILNVGGALVNFVGTGSTLSITNNLCAGGGCTTMGGLRVLITGGGSLTLTSPILNATGNTLTFGPDTAVISVAGATVKQGP